MKDHGSSLRHGTRPAGRKGFTLVELMVVGGILAVLIGLLLPAMSKVKATARRLECINMMKQWTLAFMEYKDEHHDMIPREGYDSDGSVHLNNWSQVSDPTAHDVWYNVLARDYLEIPSAAQYVEGDWPNGDFYERRSFFHCPSVDFNSLDGFKDLVAYFSMAMNSQLIEPHRAPTISFRSIRRPAHTVLFLDNLLQSDRPVVKQQATINLGQPAAMANRFAGNRHGRDGNIAFADGHVEPRKGEEVVETRALNRGWMILPQVDVIWEPVPY